MNKRPNILVCPLEWGLGHAGRMIPLVRSLQDKSCNIFIGAGKDHLALFREEISGISYISFPGFKPGYSRFLPQYIAIFLKIPVLIYHIVSEHIRLRTIIRDYKIDIVISDNRFGLWNKNLTTVYVTHQLRIPLPEKLRFLETTGTRLHRWIINKYSFCFIPDLPGDKNLSGRLSHGVRLTMNSRFIGILSRFTCDYKINDDADMEFPHNTLILSGPEPQRSMLRNKLTRFLQDKEPPTVILEGRPGRQGNPSRNGRLISCNHLPSPEMQKMITDSESIFARPGYTTIMELVSLNRGALLIPTPGQTEQEYLAGYLSGKSWFKAVSQRELDAGFDLPGKIIISGQELTDESKILLDRALDELLSYRHRDLGT